MSRSEYRTITYRYPSIAVQPGQTGGTLLGFYDTAEEAWEAAEFFLNSPPVPTEELLRHNKIDEELGL